MSLGESRRSWVGPRAGSHAQDNELLRAFRRGDAAAFDRLFENHQEYVFNVCLGILGNREDARDCTQETFIRVYRNVREFRHEAAFSTWLYRITVNTCMAHLRKRPRRPALSLEDEAVREIPDDAPETWTGLVGAEDEQLVREVVSGLNADYRTVLVLRYFQALSYDEMGGVLGYSLGQVKIKLHRARRAFARRWAERAPAGSVAGVAEA